MSLLDQPLPEQVAQFFTGVTVRSHNLMTDHRAEKEAYALKRIHRLSAEELEAQDRWSRIFDYMSARKGYRFSMRELRNYFTDLNERQLIRDTGKLRELKKIRYQRHHNGGSYWVE